MGSTVHSMLIPLFFFFDLLQVVGFKGFFWYPFPPLKFGSWYWKRTKNHHQFKTCIVYFLGFFFLVSVCNVFLHKLCSCFCCLRFQFNSWVLSQTKHLHFPGLKILVATSVDTNLVFFRQKTPTPFTNTTIVPGSCVLCVHMFMHLCSGVHLQKVEGP
jgi:uncharacterized membrane protein